jgi:hypothetical protein
MIETADGGASRRMVALRILDEKVWRPLSGWTRALFELGAAVASHSDVDGALLAAGTLPARPYGAVLLGAGAVYARAALGSITPDDARADADASRVRAIVPGTSVVYIKDQRRYSATFHGVRVVAGRAFLQVTMPDKHGATELHSFPEDEAWRIEEPAVGRPKPSSVRSQPVLRRRGFLLQALGPSGLSRLCRMFSLECVLVGKRSILRGEAFEFRLGIPLGKRRITTARLSDLLRIRTIVGSGQPFASDLVPVSNGRLSGVSNARIVAPRLVVFDGAAGFLKWRHQWPDAHWVVLLDRTDVRCADAAGIIKTLHATRFRSDAHALLAVAGAERLGLFAFTRLGA